MSIIFSYTPRHKKSTTPLIFGCARLPPLLCVLCVWGGDLHAQLFFLTGSRAVPVLFRWYLVLVLPRTSTRERSLRGRTCTRSPTLSHLQRHKNLRDTGYHSPLLLDLTSTPSVTHRDAEHRWATTGQGATCGRIDIPSRAGGRRQNCAGLQKDWHRFWHGE